MPRKQNPLKPQIIAAYQTGATKVDIARAMGLSIDVVYRATDGIPKPPRPMNGTQAINSGMYHMGNSRQITPQAMAVVRRLIGPRETILDCMARLVAEAYREG